MARYAIAGSMLLILALLGCNDGGSPTSNSGTSSPSGAGGGTPAAPVAEVLELTVNINRQCADPFCDSSNYSITFRNTGNVRLSLDFIRGVNRSGTPIFEVGSDKFIRAGGDNKLAPGETEQGALFAQTAFSLLIGYTGDNGVSKLLVFQ
jgi:hypothetical protein